MSVEFTLHDVHKVIFLLLSTDKLDEKLCACIILGRSRLISSSMDIILTCLEILQQYGMLSCLGELFSTHYRELEHFVDRCMENALSLRQVAVRFFVQLN